MKKILFYYPSRSLGGAQILFVRLANYFSKTKTYKVFIVDYEDGYLKKNVNDNVEIIDYDKRQDLEFENMIVISPLSMILSIHDNLPLVREKFLFWGIHPENLVDILRGSFRLKRLMKNSDNIVKLLNFRVYNKIKRDLKKALFEKRAFFMDKTNLDRSLSFYNLQDDKKNVFVPIPVIVQDIAAQDLQKNKMVWIGRISNDKIYSLLYALKKVDKLSKETINFYIVGDGEYKHLISKENYKNINIIEKGFLPNEQLSTFLIEQQIGLVFGMGTSILESSLLKIPSILVDPSYSEINDTYCPKWTYEIENYVLGSFETNKNINTNTFENIYRDYLQDADNLIGHKCFSYVKENHIIEKIASSLEYYFDN